MPEVCTVLNKKGKTKIIPYESETFPLKIEFFKEERVKVDKYFPKFRSYLCKIVFQDNEVQLSEGNIWQLLRRLGHVLLALTVDVEQ